jgi:hypothetical protein
MAKCCISCFEDKFIKDYVRETSSETGQCDYCGSKPRKLIDVRELSDFFDNLIGMYDESDNGYTLESSVQDEWIAAVGMDVAKAALEFRTSRKAHFR